MWAVFPAIACFGTPLCRQVALGTGVLPGLPGPWGPTPHTTTNYDYLQVGVVTQQSSSVTSYGIRTGVAMTDRSDTFSLPSEYHFRWAGIQTAADFFLQMGTAMSNPSGPNVWKTFCEGWPDHHTTDWSYFDPSATSDSNFHYYSFQASTIGSTTYQCRKDFQVLLSVDTGHSSFSAPKLDSILEVAGGAVGLDPSLIHAGTDTLSPAVDYLTSGSSWLDAPTESYYAQAWNSHVSGSSANSCPIFSIGQTLPFSTTHDITVGSGLTCHSSGVAW
jgi:hypothetical protein